MKITSLSFTVYIFNKTVQKSVGLSSKQLFTSFKITLLYGNETQYALISSNQQLDKTPT